MAGRDVTALTKDSRGCVRAVRSAATSERERPPSLTGVRVARPGGDPPNHGARSTRARRNCRRRSGAQRRELPGQTGGTDLEHTLVARQVLQSPLAQVGQRHVGCDIGCDQRGRPPRQQDLAAVGDGEEAGDPVERRPEVVIATLLGLAAVDRHAHSQRRPALRRQQHARADVGRPRPPRRTRANTDRGERPRLWFQRVPQPKSGKNRVHLDLRADDLDQEVARLVGLGASVLYARTTDDLVVMGDPEGNEFCLLT